MITVLLRNWRHSSR